MKIAGKYDPATYSNVVGSPDFGQPGPIALEAFQPLQWQLAARIVF